MRGALVAALVVLGTPAEAQRAPGLDVRIPDKVDAAVGANVALPIAIAVDRGLVVSKDAPVILDLAPDAGVTIKKRRLGRGDAVDPEADAPRFSAMVRADAPGEHAIKIRLRLWLCGSKVCRPIDVRRQATVAVVP